MDLKELSNKIFTFLDKQGFQVEQIANWKRFSDANVIIEEPFKDYEHGLQVIIKPEYFASGYDWKPRFHTKIMTYTNQNGIFITRKNSGELLIEDPPVRQIMLYYLSKHAKEKS